MAPSALTPLNSNRPLKPKEISDQATIFQWNPNIPMKNWLRTANTLIQEGKIYLQDGNFAQAYLLYMRYVTLLFDHLPSHPDAKTPEGKRLLAETHESLESIVSILERIKPIIKTEYDNWLSSEKRRKQLRQEPQRQQQPSHARSETRTTYEERASRDPALSSSSRVLDAGDYQELAVELAAKEFHRRDVNRQAGVWDNWPTDLIERQVEREAEDEELFRRQMALTRRELDGPNGKHGDNIQPQEPHPSTTTATRHSSYQYPSISKSEPIQYEALQRQQRQVLSPQPPRPPKEGIPQPFEPTPSRVPLPLAPELPAKKPILSRRALPTHEAAEELPTLPPKIHESPPVPPKKHEDAPLRLKKQRLTFRPAAYLENGEPIRSIFLPSQLRRQFLSIAAENTRRGLEMCGILCGTAVNNALFVRCLLIPEQKCTSDTCETENEGTMFEYCMNEDLLVLGWIHTHPTQTCFMSSRDLHTQAGYQVMLPESIAIVCAPSFEPSYGIFRLTNPPGLDHILGCKQSATFHPHSVDNLYTKAKHPPGHVYENDKLDFYVHDLRPGARNSTVQRKSF
ncbi:hypothetical protein F4804DRAFT_352960 [Jackrogersella minutella]|nr:hypothetical protein F4804DRAFT_352960 [Jackrogersella minutella]